MTPEPLMALVREWPHEYGYGGRQDKFGHLKSCRRCAVEAALKAWAEHPELFAKLGFDLGLWVRGCVGA